MKNCPICGTPGHDGEHNPTSCPAAALNAEQEFESWVKQNWTGIAPYAAPHHTHQA